MERKLQEFRQKQATSKPTQSSQSCIRPLQTNVKNTSPLIKLLKKLENYVVNSRLFLYAANFLSNLPIIGNVFILKIFLWLILLGLAIEVEFAMVYCVASAILVVYLTTSTRKRSRNEMSAYSVFNENCERIQGTFTAEQFEKQLRSGGNLRWLNL